MEKDVRTVYSEAETPPPAELVATEAFEAPASAASEATPDGRPPTDFVLFGPACAAGLKPEFTSTFDADSVAEVSARLRTLGFSHHLSVNEFDGRVTVSASPSQKRVDAR